MNDSALTLTTPKKKEKKKGKKRHAAVAGAEAKSFQTLSMIGRRWA